MSSPTTRVFAVVCALLALATSPLFAQGDLTGYWLDEHGGQYILRQVGSRLFWSSATLPRVANVFVGTISGNMIVGEWADLPSGELRGSGVLSLRIDSNDRLVKTGESAPYGSSAWTRSSAPAPAAGVAGIRFTFPRDQAVGFREVHTQNAPGDWRIDTQGLVGSIPNDVTYSYFFPPATVSRQNLSVSSTFRFIGPVDYNAAGVGIIDPGATHTTQTVLHCDLSERENHVGLRGGLNSVREGPAIAYQGLGRDVALNTPYTLTMEVEGTTVRCLLDGQTILTASVPDLASFPNQVHPTLHIIEANVGFTDFVATPLGRGPVR